MQMFVDMECSQTLVSARLADAAKINTQEEVLTFCAHGNIVLYLTAVVNLEMEP